CPADKVEKGYETQDVSFQPFVWFTVGFACLLILMVAGICLFTKMLTPPGSVFGRVEHAPDRSLTAFPHPQLQTNPPADLRDYLAAKNHELMTYGWIDQKAGAVHIPIDRAINLLIDRGLAVRPPDSGLTELDMQSQKAGAEKVMSPNASHGGNP
ncbi:MAG TPA: hypothetical protein VE242_12140, partial [Chthoniobacterales bacterium]|nr:hypothetical protein [Chthoniobacterales bacterium]